MNFNSAKSIIATIAERHGIPRDDMRCSDEIIGRERWRLSYRKFEDQQEVERLSHLIDNNMQLYCRAKQHGDWLEAKLALLEVRIAIVLLAGVFGAFSSDLYTVMKNSRHFRWPEIPDDLIWPANFDHGN